MRPAHCISADFIGNCARALAVGIVCLSGSLRGQGFSSCGSNVCASSGANVGIGTTTPGYNLDLFSSSASVYLQAKSTNGEGALRLEGSTANGFSRVWHLINGTLQWTVGTRYNDGSYYILRESGSGNVLISPNPSGVGGGNVGIGTYNPQSKLAVNGTITTKEVIVTNTGWADYVLNANYRLKPLSEVAAYVQENHHLPDIPSEAEVQEKGVSLGDMQVRLLAKIEELTLHMIRMEEEQTRLEQHDRELEEQNRQIRGTIALLREGRKF